MLYKMCIICDEKITDIINLNIDIVNMLRFACQCIVCDRTLLPSIILHKPESKIVFILKWYIKKIIYTYRNIFFIGNTRIEILIDTITVTFNIKHKTEFLRREYVHATYVYTRIHNIICLNWTYILMRLYSIFKAVRAQRLKREPTWHRLRCPYVTSI